ncbi:MAG: hypothetical protein E7402_02100 [Ruminococcaceae bacterium]|nr:hypothetical protein [Oscillospiraceae bacterium]
MKQKKKIRMHWMARLVISLGCKLALGLLCLGFLAERGSYLAVSMCQTAVTMFAISVVGGLLSDVVAYRVGMRE